MGRRIALAGLAGLLAAPVFLIQPVSAAILFTCDSVTGSAVFAPGVVHGKRPQSLSSGLTAPSGPADITFASSSDVGINGNGLSRAGALSADGTQLALSSESTNLDPGDTDGFRDTYVKDITTGDIRLVSTSDTGVKANADSGEWPSISADGTRVAFASNATNLDPADTGPPSDIYVKVLTTGDVMLASTSDAGAISNAGAGDPAISADGTRVAFFSNATNLDPGDTDTETDVYVKNLGTGDIALATTSDTGVKANGRSQWPLSISADGTRVAFWTFASNLDPGDTENDEDVYVKDLTTGDITLASTSDTGGKGNDSSLLPSLSADGTRVTFTSGATNLDPADTDTVFDIYVKDLTTGEIVLASTSDAGVKGDRSGSDPWLSGDGTKVAFGSSARNLDPADTDGNTDLYVKDLTTGDITLASTSDTGVKGNSDIDNSLVLSADGTHVAFDTAASNLDPADTDLSRDVYVKQLPATSTSIAIDDCSNGQSGTASVVELRSYGPRPLGCPVSLGGALGNDYSDQTPVLLGANPSLRIDWASGPDSFGVAKLKMGTTGTQWRAVLAIQASPGHDTPATNQYLPASGSGLTKTKLKGRLDWSALDSFNCTSGSADPLSWLDLVNNGSWIAKDQ